MASAARTAWSAWSSMRGQAAPHRHHGVADVLVDHALLVVDAGAEQCEMMVEQVGGLLLGQVLGLRRELDDVAEHHGHVAPARAHRVLAELHQPEDQAVRHVGAEPFQRAARLVEAVAGIVDLAQPRAAVERLVEFEPLDRLGRRGDGADRARHAEPHQQRQQRRDRERRRRRRWRRWSAGRDRWSRPRAGSTARPARDRGRSGAARGRRTPSAAPRASTTWPTSPSARSICGDAHRRIPDPGEHGIVDFLDGRQRPVLREAEAARIDQPAMRQHLVASDQDEVAAAAALARFADQVGQVADRHGGDQAADEGIVDAPNRRAHIEHRLTAGDRSRTGHPRRYGGRSAARGSAPGHAATSARETVSRITSPSGWRMTRSSFRSKVAKAALEIAGTWVIITHSASRMSTGELMSRRPLAASAAIISRCSVTGSSRLVIAPTCASTTRAARSTSNRSAVFGGAGQHHDVGDAGDQRERNEGQRQRRDQRQAQGPPRRGGGTTGASGTCSSRDIIGVPKPMRKVPRRRPSSHSVVAARRLRRRRGSPPS